MSTLKLQIEALVRVLQAPSPEDQALTMRQQTLARRERARKMALEVLSKGPEKAEKIGEALGLNAGEASQILKGLIKNGLVRNKGGRPATYAIIERGRDELVPFEPTPEWVANLRRIRIGSMESVIEDVLAAEPDVQGEPVAYAVFAENGNIRIWCADPAQGETLRLKYGDQVRPLYTAPQPVERQPDVAQLVEALVACARASSSAEVGLIVDAAIAAYRKGGGA